MRYLSGRRRIAIPVVLIALIAGSFFTASALARSSAKAVKVAIMSDCKGAFGFAQEQGIAGAQAAFA
jgi:hypothetical protein